MMDPESGTGPNQETWVDWAGPDQLMLDEAFWRSREEVVTRARALDVDVTENDLRFWEQKGVLPRPLRKWWKGATRTVYPWYMPWVVAGLRELQGAQMPLDEAAHTIRELFPFASRPRKFASEVALSLLLPHLDDYCGRLERTWGRPIFRLEINGYSTPVEGEAPMPKLEQDQVVALRFPTAIGPDGKPRRGIWRKTRGGEQETNCESG